MSSADIATLSATEKRALLQELLLARNDAPLSAGQQWIWFLQQLAPRSAAYNFPFALRVTSPLDVDVMRRALQELVHRHAGFRTTFVERDGMVAQRVQVDGPVPFHVVDASQLEKEALAGAVAAEAELPISLALGPVFRAILFQRSPDDGVLLLVWHHIVLDGWSLAVALEELGSIYRAMVRGESHTLPPVPPYAQFVQWQQEMLKSPQGEQQATFWQHQQHGFERLNLPTDHPRPAERGLVGASVFFALGEDTTAAVRALATELDTTPFVLLMACFQAALHRVSGRERIAVAFPANGRTNSRFERTTGYFVNQLAVQANVDGLTTLRELVACTRSAVLAALEHQDYHLSLLRQQPSKGAAESYAAEVMFVLQKSQGYQLERPHGSHRQSGMITDVEVTTHGTLGGLQVESYPLKSGTARFDYELQMMEHGGALVAVLQYDKELFEEQSARRLAEIFQRMVENAVKDVDQPVREIELLTGDDRRRVLVEWNSTSQQWPLEGSLASLFEVAAHQFPDAVAAMCGNEQLTFGELDSRSNRIAHWLRSNGAREQEIVGINIPRSLEMLVALMGVIKAGCVYLPLDPANPQERLKFMLRDSGAQFVVSSGTTCTNFRESGAQRLCLHCDDSAIKACSDSAVSRGDCPLLNALYTSGSTGQPKGVLGTQRGALNRLHWMWKEYPFNDGEACAQLTTLGFVDAVWEIFGPLLRGVPIVIVADDDVRDAERLVQILEDFRCTRITLVPALLRVLLAVPELNDRVKQLHYWSCSGEALEVSVAYQFHETLSNARLLNLYGCSEVAADSTCFEVTSQWRGERVPIGRPIANTHVYILDASHKAVLPGVVGEIFIGGDGLAAGYLKRPELTAERFASDPFVNNARVYKTGDLGRYRSDGIIEYMGRADHQIKIRGNRVELGEVESVLRAHPALKSAAVVVAADASGDRSLVAYFVVNERPGAPITHTVLRTHMAYRLPTYMLPAYFVQLDAMPATASGKINRRALPALDLSQRSDALVAPRSDAERRLAELFMETLGLPRIGIDDNFFEWGGHSVLAVHLAARISRLFGRAVPVALLFQHPTVSAMAAYLDGETSTPRRHQVVAVESRGNLPPLFWIPGGAGSHAVSRLTELAERLGPEQPFHAVATWRAERWSEVESVAERAAEYVNAIRAAQPHGPYFLAGFCLGGVIAFEVAQQLESQGQRVAFLALVNTWMPAEALSGAHWTTLFAQRALFHTRAALRSRTIAPHRYLMGRFRSLRRMLHRQKLAAEVEQRRITNAVDESLSEDAVLQATMYLASQYKPLPLARKLHLYLSDEPDLFGVSSFLDPRRAWRRVAATEIVEVRGSHDAMLDLPLVDDFARELRRALRKAQES